MRRSFSATILVTVNKLSCGRETQSGTSPFFPEIFGNLWIPGSILYPCQTATSKWKCCIRLCRYCGYGNVFDMTKMRISLVVATSKFEPFRNVEMSFQPGIPLVHLERCRLSPSQDVNDYPDWGPPAKSHICISPYKVVPQKMNQKDISDSWFISHRQQQLTYTQKTIRSPNNPFTKQSVQ